MNSIFINTVIGDLVATSSEIGIKSLQFKTNENLLDPLLKTECQHLNKLKFELEKYFSGKLKAFSVALDFSGTDFQKKVWSELIKIPYGETISYKELAKRIDSPKAIRAVGGANNKNRIMIVIPCHRVIGISGNLVGYAAGIDIKKRILDHEKIRSN